MIADSLDGKRIAITGTTGFVGTALVERLLRTVPGCTLVLLIRPGRRGVQNRLEREILRNDAFDRLRETHGKDGFDELCAARILPIPADITEAGLALDEAGRAALADCDVVIHSAASVSFDNPLDVAVDTNLCGPVNLIETLHALGVTPHLIAVSTAYVAGTRKGDAYEKLLDDGPYAVPVDWREEIVTARRARIRSEDESRTPKSLERFAKEAKEELGAAGGTALANKTEQLRQRWVRQEQIDLGLARAHSLDYSDAYAMTKAMAETAMAELRGEIALSIVRPSIIESSWAEPFPGWIRGFRMAEPVIIGFGRGLLTDFPGTPEGVLDVIPVDIVVATLIVVAGTGPHTDGVQVVQATSGAVNPFRMGKFHQWTTEFFRAHPIYDEFDQPIAPPQWTFPSKDKITTQLYRARSGLDKASAVMRMLPVRGSRAALAAQIDERRENLEQAIGYVDLYGKYVVCEALYHCDNLIALYESMDADDQAMFNIDPRLVDWEHYSLNIHLPSVLEQGRVKTAPSGRKGAAYGRTERLREQVMDPQRQLAAFDLENTLIQSNVVGSWGWLATRNLNRAQRARLVIKALGESLSLQRLDRRDRVEFLRHFYRRYDKAPVEQLERDAAELFSDLLIKNSFPSGIRRVRAHRAAGHRTVLITGALDFIVKPLLPLFDDVICPSLEQHDGRYTGRMLSAPPIGEARAEALRQYAATHGFDLQESVAYADSTSDLPLLEAVAFPVAVNPDTKLAIVARRRGWLVENFAPAPGGEHKILPVAPYLPRARRSA